MASGDSTRANLAIFESVNLLEGHMWDQMSLFGKAPLLRNIVWRVLKLKYCRQAARYWNQESSWALDKISHTSQSPSTTHLPRHVHYPLSNQNIWRPRHMEIPNQVKSEFGSDQVIWFSRNQRFCILLKLQEIQFPKLLLAEADHYLWSPLVSLPSTEIYHYLSPSSVSPLQRAIKVQSASLPPIQLLSYPFSSQKTCIPFSPSLAVINIGQMKDIARVRIPILVAEPGCEIHELGTLSF